MQFQSIFSFLEEYFWELYKISCWWIIFSSLFHRLFTSFLAFFFVRMEAFSTQETQFQCFCKYPPTCSYLYLLSGLE